MGVRVAQIVRVGKLEGEVVSLEVKRVLGGLPGVGAAVQARRMPVPGQDVRVGGHGQSRVQSAGEQKRIRQVVHLLAVGEDGKALERAGEVDPHDRLFRHPGQKLAVTGSRHDTDLAGQFALAIVHELPVWELIPVGALDRLQENIFQRSAVVIHRHLWETDGQVGAVHQRPKELVIHQRMDERLTPKGELALVREGGIRSKGLPQTGQALRIVEIRLDQLEVAVCVRDLGLKSGGRDDAAIAVDQGA